MFISFSFLIWELYYYKLRNDDGNGDDGGDGNGDDGNGDDDQ